jgi:hypothetical protein
MGENSLWLILNQSMGVRLTLSHTDYFPRHHRSLLALSYPT